jgi:hypothetical protein
VRRGPSRPLRLREEMLRAEALPLEGEDAGGAADGAVVGGVDGAPAPEAVRRLLEMASLRRPEASLPMVSVGSLV